eukprot:Gb_13786 [translate_table: standard]
MALPSEETPLSADGKCVWEDRVIAVPYLVSPNDIQEEKYILDARQSALCLLLTFLKFMFCSNSCWKWRARHWVAFCDMSNRKNPERGAIENMNDMIWSICGNTKELADLIKDQGAFDDPSVLSPLIIHWIKIRALFQRDSERKFLGKLNTDEEGLKHEGQTDFNLDTRVHFHFAIFLQLTSQLISVGFVTAICFTCFLIRCFVVALSAFDKNADLDVLDHPILNFIYYMLVEILPSALVLFILRTQQ